MKRLITFTTAVLILPVSALWVFALAQEAQGERVPVKAQYGDKIIYDVTGLGDPLPLQNDCGKRGGTFFAASCAECAPRCEFQQDERLIIPGWNLYHDERIGVSLNHPKDMVVHKTRPTEVSLLMRGPTQALSEEFTDGIRIRISRESYPPVLTFDEYLEEHVLDALAAGGQVLSSYPVIIGRLSGEGYRTVAEHETVHLLFPLEDAQVIAVEYTVVDPGQERFDRIVDRIISSIRLNATSL